MTPLRAVIFDIGDTLWALDPLPADLDRRMAEALASHALIPAAHALEVIQGALAAARIISTDGSYIEPDLAATIASQAERERLNVGEAAAQAAASALSAADIERIISRPEPATLFSELRALGLRIGLLSNTWTRAETLSGFVEREGALAHVHAATFSSSEGLRKPHAGLYRRALERLGTDPAETLFVGDRVLEDVVGPQQAGMRAVLTHEHRQEEPGEAAPLAIIHKLLDVKRLVVQLSTASGG